ncbi:acyl-CoA Delta(11) desaturase-like [Trichoplusia ni]|uniref:Acyl-CoA Delta(11) desaturase-like n=1 Tax=Trichoplusia ni TaxID=7111 RepID=A0A7E5VWJ5_TRINI|nr:acyl-CoA Delta(11) desaturase-like [Trichoplusia ni]
MAPITFTETELIEPLHTNDFIEYKLTQPAKEKDEDTKANGKGYTLSSYEQMLNKHDPKFLAPVRAWERRMGFLTPIRWVNAISITLFHLVAVIWLFHYMFLSNKPFRWQTVSFGMFLGVVAGFGVTGGVHRYWCHRSYKAKLPLQWILLLCYSIAGQNTIFEWVRDHRVHHKYSESSADPHDANRGFFFAHVGWLMMKKHPDVLKKGDQLDMSDITNDPLIQFHTKYFMLFKVACCWVIPSIIPALFWNESWETSIMSQAVLRYLLSLNFTWSVNSFAHLWGNKPYDKYIMPVENWLVSLVAIGEGWHNYHHTFPWDYKAAELGIPMNLTTSLLNYFASIGWAYDLKTASPSLVRAVAKARGEPQEELD